MRKMQNHYKMVVGRLKRNAGFILPLTMLLFVLFAAPVLASSGSWTLGFDLKASWYPQLDRLEIYVNDAKVSQIDASNFARDGDDAPVIPQHIDVDLSQYASPGSQVKIRLYKIAAGGKPWVLLDNVAILHNGRYVRYTNWTTNKQGTGFELKQIYGKEQRLVLKYSYDTPRDGDYAEFVSAPLSESAELEMKPSGISFSPETPIASPGTVTISSTVRNTGGLGTGNNVKMELWINDVKRNETPLFSVPSGGSATKQFSYNYAGGLDRVEARVISPDDAMGDNNRAVRYLTPAKPYLLFNSFTDVPIEKYKDSEPYRTWRIQILTYAGAYKSDPGSYGYKIKSLAAAYLITNDRSLADTAVNALLNIAPPDAPSYPEHPWINREGDMDDYILSFDMLREYIYSNRNADYFKIEEKLASMASDVKWRAFNYYTYDFLESLPRRSLTADINNNGIKENSQLITIASGLLDYRGGNMDYLDAPDTAEVAAANMFSESYLGAPLPAARLISGEGGYSMEGAYRFQYAANLALAANAYSRAYGSNLLKKYPLAKGILDVPVWNTLPAGCEPPGKGLASGSYSWAEEYILAGLFEGQDRANHQWYIDNVLKQPYCAPATSNGVIEKGLLYDYSYQSPKQPLWGTTDSYFSEANALAILRNGYMPELDATYLRLMGHKDPVWGNAETSHSYQGSYTVWSKNAYLIAERGDERGFQAPVPEYGGFGYSSFIFNDKLAFDTLEQFGKLSNPSTLESYISSGNVDAAYVRTSVNKLRDVYAGTSSAVPGIDWSRDILFPSMEYYVIADRLRSDSQYDFDMTVHYGGTEPDTSKAAYDSRYPVAGNLALGGENVDWWGSEAVTRNTNAVRWTTRSLSAIQSSIPEPQHDVEVITYIAPLTDITNYKSVQQFGQYSKPGGYMWHPYIRSRQSGRDAKYLTVQYPRDVTAGEPEPSIQQIAVSGGDGSDYAIKLARGAVVDLASVSDGELIAADSMRTDAEVAFSRFDGSLKYFLMKNGSAFSYGDSDRVALSKRVTYLVVNYKDEGAISFKIKGTGSVKITFKGLSDVNYAVNRDGAPYSNFTRSGSDLVIATELSDHAFEVLPSESQTPRPTPTPVPTASGKTYFTSVEAEQNGWQTSGLWHVTDNKYNSPTHSFWYGDEGTKTYDTGGANSGSLVSPEIQLQGSQPVLSFMSWYYTEVTTDYDKKLVQISVDGGPWTTLKQITHPQQAWVREAVSLSEYAGSKVKIRFLFDTVDEKYNGYGGWYLDDLEVN